MSKISDVKIKKVKEEIEKIVDRIQNKLSDYKTKYLRKIPLDSEKEIYNYIQNEEKYKDVVELIDIIYVISDIERKIRCAPKIYELYGLRDFLLELEEKIVIIDSIDDFTCINFIFKFIDDSINWNLYKNIQ